MFDPSITAPEEITPDGNITEDVVRSAIARDPDAPDAARLELVKRLQAQVVSAKRHWKNDFERMKKDQQFVRGAQWDGEESSTKYTCNIIQRHIGQRVASLYAKNPKIVVRKRKTLDFKVWDESTDALATIQQALAAMGQTGMPLPPQIMDLVADIAQGIDRKKMLQKIADTLEIIYDYTLDRQSPPFKKQMKQLVRRTCTNGVGYVKIGYARSFKRSPDDLDRINGLTEQISNMERIIADRTDDVIPEECADIEQLRLQLADYQKRVEQIDREGLTFDFPTSTSIIIDPACRVLSTFTGARWIAQEFILSNNDVKEIYKVDLKNSPSVMSYSADDQPTDTGLRDAIRRGASGESEGGATPKRKVDGVCVWEIWDKTTGQTCTIAEGHNDFLSAPAEPDIFLPRFWPIFPLMFNEAEDEDGLYPRSDVHLLSPMQKEYNRSREGLRQHRIANRPKHAVAVGQLSEDDMTKLETHPAHAVITLNGLAAGGDIAKLIQPIKGAPIDGPLYDTSQVFEDVLRVVGQSDASIGAAQGGVTATGDSIAEQNRGVSIASNVDDLDDVLNEMARSAGHILLSEMSAAEATRIAGPGAVWPTLTSEEIADELLLEVEAGSSGRPNKAAEVANLQQLAPFLLQIPGIRPDWLLKQFIKRLDDNMDLSEAIAAGLPSIVAQNAMSKMTQGAAPAPGQDAGGADNEEKPAQPSGGTATGPPAALPPPMG